jgi:hypothetical protein
MKRPLSQKHGRGTTHKTAGQRKCPHCAEWLGLGTVHICPVGCCYVAVTRESVAAVCPYCENTFETGVGHVCLELLKRTDPAQ